MKKFLTFLLAGLLLFGQANALAQEIQQNKEEKYPIGSCIPFERGFLKNQQAVELVEKATGKCGRIPIHLYISIFHQGKRRQTAPGVLYSTLEP